MIDLMTWQIVDRLLTEPFAVANGSQHSPEQEPLSPG